MEIHREVAERLRAEPGLLAVAAGNLERWLARHGEGPLAPCYREWQSILEAADAEEIAVLLTREGEREDRLRQNSPFAGVLGPRELWRIKKEARNATA